jgi:predicted dehydrogenase
MTTLRIGLAGYGSWGAAHAVAIAHLPDARLTAIADASPARRADAQQALNAVTVLDDWNALLSRSDVDLVDIALPSPQHFEAARAAIEAGRHVLVEAPLVEQFRQADELIGRACEHEVMLAVGHQRRLSPLWGQLKTLLTQGVVGRPQRIVWNISHPADPASVELLHAFDLARWYLSDGGEPQSVCLQELDAGTHLVAVVDLAEAAFPSHISTPTARRSSLACTVAGERGTLQVTCLGGEAPRIELRSGTSGRIEPVSNLEAADETVSLVRHLAAVVHATVAGQSPPAGGADGRSAVRMLQAAQESLRLGRALRIGEVA